MIYYDLSINIERNENNSYGDKLWKYVQNISVLDTYNKCGYIQIQIEF